MNADVIVIVVAAVVIGDVIIIAGTAAVTADTVITKAAAVAVDAISNLHFMGILYKRRGRSSS